MISFVLAALVSASSLDLPPEYYVVSDFISAHKQCTSGRDSSCARHIELCNVVLKNDIRIKDYIANGYPIRGKNGGMNIKARYDRAVRDCNS